MTLNELELGDSFTLVRTGCHYKVVSNSSQYNTLVRFLYTGDTTLYPINRQSKVIKYETNK